VNGNQPTQSLTVASTTRRVAVDPVLKVKRIAVLLLDVDGVLTDGGLFYADNGDEMKRFHVRDGMGIRIWQSLGLRVAVLSGRTSPALERRAKELDIFPIVQGQTDKRAALQQILDTLQVEAEQVCVVGDDLPELPLMARCGISAAVADAALEVRAVAQFITTQPGGHGAVREVIEWILKLRGDWTQALQAYQG